MEWCSDADQSYITADGGRERGHKMMTLESTTGEETCYEKTNNRVCHTPDLTKAVDGCSDGLCRLSIERRQGSFPFNAIEMCLHFYGTQKSRLFRQHALPIVILREVTMWGPLLPTNFLFPPPYPFSKKKSFCKGSWLANTPKLWRKINIFLP
jgi:hypothetical protein